MQSTEWIPTHFKPTDFKRVISIRGRSVNVSVSPYDIPEAMRGTVIGESRVGIEFKYINNEEDREVVSLSPDILAFVGKASHRVYAVEFTLDPNVGSIVDQLKIAASAVGRALSVGNSQLVEGAIQTSASDIVFG